MTLGRSSAIIVERVATPVRAMHGSISESWFKRLGTVAVRAGDAHRVTSDIVYDSVVALASVIGPSVDAAFDTDSAAAIRARAVVNSLWGDDLGQHNDFLSIPMTAHHAGGDTVHNASGPPPVTTGRLVILVHGLSDTESCWAGEFGLLSELDQKDELTSVTIRYNPGLAIAENGRDLADLIDDMIAGWPVAVESVALVGYSMGGLVIHQALEAAHAADQRWVDVVGDVISIAAPHRGSWIESAVSAAAWGLGIAPHTRPLADFLDTRSRGIRDLRHGAPATHTGWVPPHAQFHFVSGTVTNEPAHPIGVLVGDLVVQTDSASNHPHLIATNSVVLGGTHHLNLLDDPATTGQIMEWITATS